MKSSTLNGRARFRLRDAVFAVLAIGCSDPTGSSNDDRGVSQPAELAGNYPEARGQRLPIPEISVNSALRWEDPDEIVFNTEGSAVVARITEIRALRLSDFSSRALHSGGTSGGYTGYGAVAVSPDGRQTYFVLGKPVVGEFDLFQAVMSAAPVVIAINPRGTLSGGSGPKNSAYGAPILPRPDSRGAAYAVGPDSIRMYDSDTRSTRRIGEGCGAPVAFSPDGDRLLCRRSNSFYAMMLSDGSLERVAATADITAVLWGAKGVKLIATSITGGGLTLIDVGTATSRTLLQPGSFRLFEGTAYSNIAWSRDGKKVAVSTSRGGGLFSRIEEFVVYVIDTETGDTQRAAVVKAETTGPVYYGIGQMAFSPDGQAIAYAVGTLSSAEVYLAKLQ